MRLPYSLIFRSGGTGEDGNEIACGLSMAYMRFLFALQDYHHAFWGDERVTLSDAETQLLERGRAALTRIFRDGGCNVLVSDARLATEAFEYFTNVEAVLPFVDSASNTDYGQWNGSGGFVAARTGLFWFSAVARNDGIPTTAVNFRHFLRLRYNSLSVGIYDDKRASGDWDTLAINVPYLLNAGDIVSFHYLRGGTGQVFLRIEGSFVKVTYLG